MSAGERDDRTLAELLEHVHASENLELFGLPALCSLCDRPYYPGLDRGASDSTCGNCRCRLERGE